MAAAVNGAMHGSRGCVEGRCSSMDHDREAASQSKLCHRDLVACLGRLTCGRGMSSEQRPRDTHAKTSVAHSSVQDMHALGKYAMIYDIRRFQCVATLSTACISRRGPVLLPALPFRDATCNSHAPRCLRGSGVKPDQGTAK